MTPRRLDGVVITAKLRTARLVAAVPLASEQYADYVRQVARWVVDRSG